MTQSSLSSWIEKFTDPYALLGVSVTADDRRILKRYRTVAKILHPDSYAQSDAVTQELASQIFARLVNPAYQRLKQEKGRAETKALLRFQVRRLIREMSLEPKSELACTLLHHPATEVDVFYEQAIVQLAEFQYQPFDQFEAITEQLGELNLVYLQLKMGEIFVNERRTGLINATEAQPIQLTPVPATDTVTESYAQRHYRRAQEYAKKGNWTQVVQELRDAIKLEADKSEYHALLGLAYFKQNLLGMAKVYLRQALKLNPQDSIATKYAAKLGVELNTSIKNQQRNDKVPIAHTPEHSRASFSKNGKPSMPVAPQPRKKTSFFAKLRSWLAAIRTAILSMFGRGKQRVSSRRQ